MSRRGSPPAPRASRPFECGDRSRDNPLLGVLALGESRHNSHHAFPTWARHGLAWWKLGVSYWVMRALAPVDRAWNVRLPSRQSLGDKRRHE